LGFHNRNAATIGALLLVVAVSTGCMFRASEVEAPPPVQPIPEPERVVFTVKKGRIAEEVTAVGRIVAQRDARLYFGVTGRVRSVEVEVGSTVQKGQVLARLDNADLEVQARLLEIDLEKLSLRAEQARAKLPSDEYEIRMIELDREQTRIRRDQAFRRLADTMLVAPYEGVVIQVDANLRQGRDVSALSEMLVIADPTGIEVRADVTPREVALLAAGQRVAIQGDGGLRTTGEILAVAGPASGMHAVRIAFVEGVPNVRLGSLVRLNVLVREEAEALILPNSAVREFDGRHFVQVLENGRKRQLDVEIGIRTATETQIVRGLSEGQEVLGR
jgi:membrane fusion protein, macrolide-specific efflux system